MRQQIKNRWFKFKGSHTDENPKNEPNIVLKPVNKPLYIEFIGMSGVGKTTLYNELLKRENNGNWVAVKPLMSHLSNPDIPDDTPQFYEDILNEKYRIVSRDNSLKKTIRFMNFFFKNIKEDIVVNALDKNYNVVFEDGIFHNFGDAILSLYRKNDENINSIFENRAVVYCHNSPQNIARRILKREQETGNLRPQHTGLSLEELIRAQEKIVESEKEFLAVLSKFEIPILKIDTSENLKQNAQKVDAFIRELSST